MKPNDPGGGRGSGLGTMFTVATTCQMYGKTITDYKANKKKIKN